jgi:regulator of nucleoside diphosphate kinase
VALASLDAEPLNRGTAFFTHMFINFCPVANARASTYSFARSLVMTTHPLFLTQSDHQQLSALLQASRRDKLEDPVHLNGLARELDAATVVPGEDVPADVVTLHTRMKLEFPESQRTMSCQVVLPTELNFSAGRVSVLSPLGTALIGRRVGDDVKFAVRGVPRSVRIVEILYQPESAERRDGGRARRFAG